MYQLLAKKGQLFAVILGVVVIAIFLGSVISGLGSAGFSMSDDLNQIMKNNPDQEFGFFDPGLKITMVMAVIAVAIAVLFGIYHVIAAPKDSIISIIALAVIVGLFFILYSNATSGMENMDSSMARTLMKFDVSENISKLISGGIWTTAILIAAAVASMILFEIYNLFK